MYIIPSKEKKDIIRYIIDSKISVEDYDTGFAIFIEIVNMPMNGVAFGEEQAEKLVVYDPYDDGVDIEDLMCIKDFWDKLYLIINKSDSDDTFEEQMESALINPDYSGYKKEYQTVLDMYRQISIKSDPDTSTLSLEERKNKIACVWRVIIHQCLTYKDEIKREAELSKQQKVLDLNYKSYAEKKIEEIKDEEKEILEKKYFNLKWETIVQGKNSSKKYIGAPGSGKTTKMRKEYLSMLEKVKTGEKELFPVWINLRDFNNEDTYDLIEKIETVIGKKNIYDAILDEGKIILFLDGFNEILLRGNDTDGGNKDALARKITEMHRNYPAIEINMTDRAETYRIPCLEENVDVLRCKGLNEDVIADYCKQQGADNEIIEQIKNIEWLKADTKALTPYQVNILIDIVKEKFEKGGKYEPVYREAFIRDYLVKLYERERDHGDPDIKTFTSMMEYIANDIIEDVEIEIKKDDLIDELANEYNSQDVNPLRMYNLALDFDILYEEDDEEITYVFFEEEYYYRYHKPKRGES